DCGAHRSIYSCRFDATGGQLAFVCREYGLPERVLPVRQVSLGRSDAVRGALASALRGQRENTDDGHDRRSGPANTNKAKRRVLPGLEDAEERDIAGANAGRVSRLAPTFAPVATAALSDGVVREVQQ